MSELGPVSKVLAAEVRGAVRKHGVVVWLDGEGAYSGFVDRLRAAKREPFEVHGYRGSYLDLMLELEHAAGGADRPPLLIHMPGHTEESIRTTPLLELYAAGVRFRKKPETLVTEAAAGEVTPERVAAFLRPSDGAALTLERADAWLEAIQTEREGGLRSQLQVTTMAAILDDLLTTDQRAPGPIAARLKEPGARDAVLERASAALGLTPAWRALPGGTSERAEDLAFVIGSWSLAVEYVHDLARPTRTPILGPLAGVTKPHVEACGVLATHLRSRQATFYKSLATEVEGWLPEEVSDARAGDLGRIDTFRFEEDRVLQEALARLEGACAVPLAWAVERTGKDRSGESFWLRDDAGRRAAWLLIAEGGRLGAAIAAAGALGRDGVNATVDDAVARYVAVGAAVDEAHRRLEQRRTALLFPQLPYFERLRAKLDELREAWRTWADEWARDFNARAKAHGFLPSAGLQRQTYAEVVAPLLGDDAPTAFFMVDALRYEMGAELSRLLTQSGTTVSLKARLAELPTTTEIGMNALAPVSFGGPGETPRMKVVMKDGEPDGFASGELRVGNPDTRRRVMADRAGGPKCPLWSLGEVVDRDVTSLRQGVAGARLVVIHSQEIDQAGEKGVGTLVFEQVLQKLVAACHILRDAGVRRFVITADHGFLLLDETAREAQSHGRKIDPQRRHVVSPLAADHADETRVALADLGYENAGGMHLMMPSSTAIFDRGRKNKSFAHGGNSLQERVIPVITLTHKMAPGGTAGRYIVKAQAGEPLLGMQSFTGRVEVEDAQLALPFAAAKTVDLALRPAETGVDVRVELCQTRGAAELVAGVVRAQVAKDFELFFRLVGMTESRVRVDVFHPGVAVEFVSAPLPGWFDVSPMLGRVDVAPVPNKASIEGRPSAAPPASDDWLDQLGPAGPVFAHILAHGSIGDDEVAAKLGGARAARRFALELEQHLTLVPFRVVIDGSGSQKRYVREGM